MGVLGGENKQISFGVKTLLMIYITINQQDAADGSQFFILMQGYSTCVGCFPHPSSGVH